MANVSLWGAVYADVPTVLLPKQGGGTAAFDDTTIASNAATAADIISGKLAWVNGSLVTGTGSGGGGTIYEDSGSMTLTADFAYTNAANTNYTGSILIATQLSKILALELWSEAWLDQTAVRPCFGCFCWFDSSFGITRLNAGNYTPFYYGAGRSANASATDWMTNSVTTGPILHCMTDSVPEGSFGIKTHNATDYKLKAGDVIHWHAIGTKA